MDQTESEVTKIQKFILSKSDVSIEKFQSEHLSTEEWKKIFSISFDMFQDSISEKYDWTWAMANRD